MGNCHTIGDLIKDLQKNFDKGDFICILTLFTIEKDAKIDVENSCTCNGGSHVSNVSYNLEQIAKRRNAE